MTILWLLSNWKWLLGAAATGVLAVLLGFTTIDRNQWRAAARKSDSALAKVGPAQEAARIAAQAAHDAQEQRYKDHADVGDTHHTDIAANAATATDRFRIDNRVCPASNPGAASKAPASPGGGSASVPASVPASGLVAVSDADVQACAGAVAYSIAAHDWAAGLNLPQDAGSGVQQ